MVESAEVEMAVIFCHRLIQDLARGPRQPWHLEGRWVTSADDRRIAEMVSPSEGQLIAGTLSASVAINSTLHKLAHLLAEAARNGPGSHAGKRLKAIMARLLAMQAEGKLPDLG